MECCANSSQHIQLCAPFIKQRIVSDICRSVNQNIEMTLVTNINLQSFHMRASDVSAIDIGIKNNWNIYNCTTLHAKIYIFDYKYCIITSANLTPSGLSRNIECSILTDDFVLVKSASDVYSQIVNNDCIGKISKQTVSELSSIINNLPKTNKMAYPSLDLSTTYSEDILPIVKNLTGWKKSVFTVLNNFRVDEFSSQEVLEIAETLKYEYPQNYNREAKVRQILQQLRDIGLVEFTSPGKYKKLWIRGDI